MMFTITNKSDDQMVNVYFSDVVVDGETLQPMFGLDVEAQTSEDQICLVDCDAAPSALTGIVCVDDMEGYTIGKTDKKIQATFDTVLVNGKEEEISYVADAMGHTYATLFCDVSDVKAMTTLTGEFTVYDEDDELIGSYSIAKAALK